MPFNGVSASQELMPEAGAGGGGTYAICRLTGPAVADAQSIIVFSHTIMVQQMLSVQPWFSSACVEPMFNIRFAGSTWVGSKFVVEHCEAPWAWYMLTICCVNGLPVCATLTIVERDHPATGLQSYNHAAPGPVSGMFRFTSQLPEGRDGVADGVPVAACGDLEGEDVTDCVKETLPDCVVVSVALTPWSARLWSGTVPGTVAADAGTLSDDSLKGPSTSNRSAVTCKMPNTNKSMLRAVAVEEFRSLSSTVE